MSCLGRCLLVTQQGNYGIGAYNVLVQPILLGLLFQYIWIFGFPHFGVFLTYKGMSAFNAASHNILMDKPIEIFAR